MEDKIERMRMLFLVNADDSLIGLKFQNFELLKIDEKWLSFWLEKKDINWLKSLNLHIEENWLALCCENSVNKYPHKFQNYFLSAVHIFYHTDINIKQHILGRRKNNEIIGSAGDGFPNISGFYNINDGHDIMIKEELQTFLNKYNIENFIPTLNTALDFFYLCLRTDNISLRFVLLISILEILFIPDGVTNELGYRASRNTAVFLGKTNEESNYIFEKINHFYKYRSHYIHSGVSDKVTRETLYELSEYIREILKNMIIKKDLIGDKKTYAKKLNESAFGDNPYNIE